MRWIVPWDRPAKWWQPQASKPQSPGRLPEWMQVLGTLVYMGGVLALIYIVVRVIVEVW